MHFFTEYIQPLTLWIQAHPHLAIFFTFLISLAESFAIIGSIVPGSVTMTAVGFLAGSGIIRIDLTFIAAILGAIAGDGLSYLIGSVFHNKLSKIWPFSRHPHLLDYGKDYFAKHGGKSVFFGRFIGPLRSIIPLIAGMMHMNHWQFFTANMLSAVGWSLLYLLPGVLIGAASSQLSTEAASKLFMFILLILIAVWLLGFVIKWIVQAINQLLRTHLHTLWLWSKEHPRLINFFRLLTPEDEVNHYPTAGLLLLFSFMLLLSLTITILILQASFISGVDTATQFFMQSIRTSYFDHFFVFIILFIKPFALLSLSVCILLYAIYHRDWRTVRYWFSLIAVSLVTVGVFVVVINVPKAATLLNYEHDLFFPAIDLTFAAALFGFLMLYISYHYRTMITLAIRIFLMILLLLTGLASLYLGDNWLSNLIGAYVIGTSICLIHWILYRRISKTDTREQLPIVLSFVMLLLAAAFSAICYYQPLLQAHSQTSKKYLLNDWLWWNQQQPLLPLYASNRIGQPIGLFNIQYEGSIRSLTTSLAAFGWKKQSHSILGSLMNRANNSKSQVKLPLMAPLYLNQKPVLIMTYTPQNNEPTLLLCIWNSNYYLQNYDHPIWIGSITPLNLRKTNRPVIYPFKYVVPALFSYKMNYVPLREMNLNIKYQTMPPALLIIRD